MTETPQPLAGVRIIDLGVGMAPALAAKLLVAAGAEVTRLEPPDGDPFYDVYPAYGVWQRGKEVRKSSPELLATLLRAADICICGGEDFPGLDWRHDAAALRAASDRLIVLDFAAAPADWDEPAFPAVELFAQARSGLVFEHFSDRPISFAFPMASYGAALHGVAALLAALWARATTGRGDLISTSLLQGVLRWNAILWAEAENPGPTFNAFMPKDVVPFRFRCADGDYVHLNAGVPGAYGKIYDILGIDDPSLDRNARGSPTGGGDPRFYFGDIDLIGSYVANWRRPDFLKALWANQLPAEAVLGPGGCWDDTQTIHNGIIARDAAGTEFVGDPFLMATGPEVAKTPRPPASPSSKGPLAGVRVADLGSFAAGPHSSVILGDLGADIIKIERPEGDPMRSSFRHYAASNRGKRSVAIDAKAPEGAEIIRRICATADIVHHNFRPGVSARLGVDAKTLQEVNPAIIVLECSAYGPTGPKSLQSGFDPCLQALCGHQPRTNRPEDPPLIYRFAIVDYGTGALGAIAMSLALLMKQKHGTGTAAHVSLLNSGIFLMSELVRHADGSFAGGPAHNAARTGNHPAESLYQTSDGWIAIAARGDAMARRLAAALGLKGPLAAPRRAWGDAEAGHLSAVIAGRPSTEILALLKAADVWAEPCRREITDTLHGPRMQDWGMVLDSDSADFGHLRQVGRAVSFTETELPGEGRGLVDPVGGHTRQILAECGYSEPEIAGFFARGIVA